MQYISCSTMQSSRHENLGRQTCKRRLFHILYYIASTPKLACFRVSAHHLVQSDHETLSPSVGRKRAYVEWKDGLLLQRSLSLHTLVKSSLWSIPPSGVSEDFERWRALHKEDKNRVPAHFSLQIENTINNLLKHRQKGMRYCRNMTGTKTFRELR